MILKLQEKLNVFWEFPLELLDIELIYLSFRLLENFRSSDVTDSEKRDTFSSLM